jgi:hypothetical protein
VFDSVIALIILLFFKVLEFGLIFMGIKLGYKANDAEYKSSIPYSVWSPFHKMLLLRYGDSNGHYAGIL